MDRAPSQSFARDQAEARPVSKYDIFLTIANKKNIETSEIVSALWLKDDRPIKVFLEELERENLIRRSQDEYSCQQDQRADLLKRLLSFAIAYNINYNHYFDPDLLEFLRRTYHREYFTINDIPARCRKPFYIRLLLHDGLVLIYKFKPLIGKLIENLFLDHLLEYHRIVPERPKSDKRIEKVTVIFEKMMSLKSNDHSQIFWAKNFMFSPESRLPEGLGPESTLVQRIIKYDLIPDTKGIFDQVAEKNYRQAVEQMRSNVRERKRLDVNMIFDYHRIIMKGTGFEGNVRRENVVIKDNPYFKTAPPRKIISLLRDLMQRYRKTRFKGIADVLKFAAYMNNHLIYIHPFVDGNSRTIRIIIAHLLTENSVPFEEIPECFVARHLKITKGERKRDDDKLFNLFQEILIYTLNCEELRRAKAL